METEKPPVFRSFKVDSQQQKQNKNKNKNIQKLNKLKKYKIK